MTRDNYKRPFGFVSRGYGDRDRDGQRYQRAVDAYERGTYYEQGAREQAENHTDRHHSFDQRGYSSQLDQGYQGNFGGDMGYGGIQNFGNHATHYQANGRFRRR